MIGWFAAKVQTCERARWLFMVRLRCVQPKSQDERRYSVATNSSISLLTFSGTSVGGK
jgi:hypothetical protein